MIIYFVFLVLLLVGRQAVILMLIQYLSAWRHAETHSFIHSVLADPLLCAKHYARSWGPHDEQSEHCSCLHGMLILDAQYVPLSLGLGLARLLHLRRLSLSSCHLSLPWVPGAGLPSLPPPNPPPQPAQSRQQQTDSTFENIPFNMSHPSLLNLLKIFQ